MKSSLLRSSHVRVVPLAAALAACGSRQDGNAGPIDPPHDAGSDAPTFAVEPFDDWEDGDLDINVAGGRFGHWYNYDDATEGMNHVAAVSLDPASERHTTWDTVSKMALRVQSSGYTRWGSGFSADVGGGSPYDVSAYTGIAFWTRNLSGHPNVIRVVVQDVNADPRGGLCDKTEGAPAETACYDAFGKNIDVSSSEWQIHLLPFWSLRQGGYGRKAPMGLDKQQVFAIAFANNAGSTYDYNVDDIVFYKE